MATVQGNLINYNGDKVAPNTLTSAVYDAAKQQALSATLANTPDKSTLGYPAFSTLSNYAVGDVVYYLTKLWRFVSAHTRGDWNAAEVEEFSVKDLAGEIDTRDLVAFLNRALGKYDTVGTITLSQGKSGKYVNVNGGETLQSGYGISNPVNLNFGDILLVPSAQAVPASVSVVARVVTRTYAKVINYTYTYRQDDPTLYDTATADYDQTLVYTAVYDTSGETPVLTGWTIGGTTIATLPATHDVTESYYEPLVKQAVAAMPSTGYYVYLCPQAMTVVVSGLTATVNGGVCLVVGLGIFKNIVSNFLSMPGQNTVAQALCDLEASVNGIKQRLVNLGEVKAITVDSENLPMVCGQPLVIEGAGSPSVVPHFVGQRYHDTTGKKVYEAFSVTGSTNDWTLLN